MCSPASKLIRASALAKAGVVVAVAAGLAALSPLQAQTELYWNGGNGVWTATPGNANWANSSGGTADSEWLNAPSAPYTNAVITSANPTLTVGTAAAPTVNVGDLSIQNGLTLVQFGSTGVLNVYGAGTGNLNIAATGLQLQVKLEGTTAWNGRITLNDSPADNNNYLYVNNAAAVGTSTSLQVDSGRVFFSGAGSTFTVGALSGASTKGWVRSSATSGNATLRIEQSTNTTYAGKIGGSNNGEYNLNLVKAGTGTLVLSGNVDHRGSTTVEAGRLYFNGTSAGNSLNGATVSGGATIGGSGLIGIGGGASRNVTIASGGRMAPGGVNEIGTLTINGSSAVTSAGLIFSGTAEIEMRLAGLGQNDKIVLSGFSASGGKGSAAGGAESILFDLANYNGLAELGTYDLITFANAPGIAISAFALSAKSILDGWEGSFGYDGNTLQFTATSVGAAVPEPATCAMLLAGLLVGGCHSLARRRLPRSKDRS